MAICNVADLLIMADKKACQLSRQNSIEKYPQMIWYYPMDYLGMKIVHEDNSVCIWYRARTYMILFEH